MRALLASTTRHLLAWRMQWWSCPPRRIVVAVSSTAAILFSSLIFACAHFDMRVAMLSSRSTVGIITGVAYLLSSSVSRWMEVETSSGIIDGEEEKDGYSTIGTEDAMRGGDFASAMAVPVCIHALVNWQICAHVILGAT